MYQNGLGVPPDQDQAATWFHEAAEHGYAPAMVNLGAMYNAGVGVPRDNVEGVVWYSLAIAKLLAPPMRRLVDVATANSKGLAARITNRNSRTRSRRRPTTTMINCVDKSTNCISWSISGYCSSQIVTQMCPRSCNICYNINMPLTSIAQTTAIVTTISTTTTTLTTTITTTTTTTTKNTVVCVDQYPSCINWALSGYCTSQVIKQICR